MENKSYMILGVGIALVVIVVIAAFVFAGDLTGGTETNLTSKVYDSVTKTATIVDSKDGSTNIAKVQLKTPLTVIVPVGYQKIAEFEITSHKNFTSAFEKMEFYDNNAKDIKSIDKQFDYKILINESYEVNDYAKELTCEKNTDPKNLTDAETCFYKIIGTHKEYSENWIPLAKADFIEGNKYTIGIWVQVNMYDNVEWVPTMFGGIRISEWANYVQSSGTKTYTDIGGVNYTVWTYTSNGTFNWTGVSNLNASILVVGGGGGGGGSSIIPTAIGGGGGAGGFIYYNAFNISNGNYNVVIGIGGGSNETLNNGTNSSFSTLVAWGGGGGRTDSVNTKGYDGGSGGGGSSNSGTGGAGIAGQGYSGGTGASARGGGGGGSSFVGKDGNTTAGGFGGNGSSSTIYNGTALWYAGGGGGGSQSAPGGTGGIGGGGSGSTDGGNGIAGINGKGGGGGAGGYNTGQGASGGSGVVIIRYKTSDDTAPVCNFSGYVKDGNGNALNMANVTVVNQADATERYTVNSSASGYWTVNITNSTNTYLAYTYYNNTLVGGIKPYISGQC